MSAKRKRVVVSLETKINAIRRLDNGESIKKVALDLGVGEVTVGDWRRKRANIEKWTAQASSFDDISSRKTMKKCEYEKTSEALFIWFSQMRSQGSPISGPIVQAKAIAFQKHFKDGEGPFTASVGWLDRWKRRYGIRQLNIGGEKLSADHTDVVAFKERLKKHILQHGLTSDQIFNCDETGLNYRMLPSKTLASRDEQSAPGYKKCKDRVTVLGCYNSSGSLKLKPMIIGKAKNPRALKNVNVSCLPVLYKSQKSAWMDAQIFKDWFHNHFVPLVEAFLETKHLPRKAVLLLDNARSHPDVEDLSNGEIRAVFLPPNVTSLIQPLDQGSFETFKRNYRKRLLSYLIEQMDEGKTVPQILKAITVKDVVYWTSEAWDSVSDYTVRESWRKLFDIEKKNKNTANCKSVEMCNEELVVLTNKLPANEPVDADDIVEWLNGDEVDELTDSAIADIVNAEQESGSEESGDEGPERISHSDGLKAFEAALAYVEQQSEATAHDVLWLKRWRNIAANKRGNKLQQTKINNFFTKV